MRAAAVEGGPRVLQGVICGVSAYLLWGVFPLYFRAVRAAGALEILSHRIVWSAALLGVLVLLRRQGRAAVEELRARPWALLATAGLISGNWLLYVWAVNSNRVLESSLGYFINPLVNVVLGALVLGERLSRRQVAAVALAAAGVLVLVAKGGVVPWVALGLAASFSLYALVRKTAGIDPFRGLFIETALAAPAALGWLLWKTATGGTAFVAGGWSLRLLLLSAGPVTAVPLVCFGHAARHLRLSTVGLLQYISPTGQFVLAVAIFGERFTLPHAVTFGLIWAALAIYCADALVGARRAAASAPA